MAKGVHMQAIKDEIARITRERDALTNKLEGLRSALALITGETETVSSAPKARQRRGNLKSMVLDIVTAQAERGVTVLECVALGKERGETLDRGSVSSLLSKLKAIDVLFYDGERYRLKQYAGPRQAA